MMHFMLDLETMSTEPNAAIVAIGAVAFDPELFTLHPLEFYMPIGLRSSMTAGLHVSAETICWWLTQSDAARAELVGRTTPLPEALSRFASWMTALVPTRDDRKVWGNGAAFDNTILASAYAAVGATTPWRFWNDRCYRTMKSLYPDVTAPTFVGEQHKAVDDARHQALHLMEILKGVR
jgi:hypothetical protein